MGFELYYYALNRRAAERVFDLTWNQFLKKFGWSKRTQFKNVGDYLAFSLDKPDLPDEPTPEEIAPILRRTIRDTVRHISLQYYSILELGYNLGKRSFVKSDIDVKGLEDDLVALNACAISAFLSGSIDDRTLWCVLTMHEAWWSPDLHWLSKVDRRRVNAAVRRFGRCRPIFDWQPVSAVRDGFTALSEEDTRRFVRFLRLAWQHNWPVFLQGSVFIGSFRSFNVVRKLHRACPKFLGNCLVHYWGN